LLSSPRSRSADSWCGASPRSKAGELRASALF
jgi:hypothetical protein